jgi:hypothetical protein
MIKVPCPCCFIGSVGTMPIVNFDPEVQSHCDPFAVLTRHNRDPDDEYLVVTCPWCNQEMESSPLEVGLEDQIQIEFELDEDEDEEEEEDDQSPRPS